MTTFQGLPAARPIIFSAPMVCAILKQIKTGNGKTQTRRLVKGIPEHARLVTYTAESDQSELAHSLGWFEEGACDLWPCNRADRIRCPYGQPGDLLWVRETWADVNSEEGPALAYRADGGVIAWHDFSRTFGEDYGAGPSMDYDAYPGDYMMWHSDLLAGAPDHKWRTPIFMPKWASRLTLRVTKVRAQRVQEISETDAQAEGCTGSPFGEKADAMLFPVLWDSLNATPKPRYQTIDGKRQVTHYESYPWEEGRRTETYRGLDHHIFGNPSVWAIDFVPTAKNVDEILGELA